jgi:chemosensory pili system protein ChpE
MLSLSATAFGLGLLFNAAPGPVFAETVRRGTRGGFKPALAVQLGSIVGDALWAMLGLLGVGVLVQIEPLRVATGVGGTAYLLWLALQAWRESRSVIALGSGTPPAREAFRSGVLLSLTNPQNIAYWAAIGSALGAIGIDDPTISDYAAFFVGFMLSSIVWAFACAAIVDSVLGAASVRWARVTYCACAVAFVALAAASLRDLLGSLREASTAPAAISLPVER